MGDPIKLPRGERPRTGYYNKAGVRQFLLTQKGDEFVLYRTSDGSLTKLGKGKSPDALVEKFNVQKEMRK